MARIRSVSPALRTSETCAGWDRETRYTWVLLWGYLDDYGLGVDNAKVIAADCYPLDDDVTAPMMRAWLDQYEGSGSTCHYEFEGKRYLHVLNWSEHQKPQHPSKARIVPCPQHEAGAHRKWLSDRAADQAKVSGNPHEGFVSVSPTSRGGGEVSWELSDGVEGGQSSGAATAKPPLYADRCRRHDDDAEPPPCGACADVRKANAARPPLALVPSTRKRCLVHDQTFTTVCSGCRADEIAAEESA